MKAPAESEVVEDIPVRNVPSPPLSHVHTIIKGPGGRIFLSDEFNHRVLALENNGEVVFSLGGKGIDPGKFWYPRGLAIVDYGDGARLAVCDSWNHRIQLFSLDGGFEGSFGAIGSGPNELNEPVGVAAAENGLLWVLDRGNNRVKLVDAAGSPLRIHGRHMTTEEENRKNDPAEVFFPTEGILPPPAGYSYPQAFALTKDKNILVADTNNRRLCLVSGEGRQIDFVYTSPLDSGFHPVSVTMLDGEFAIAGSFYGRFLLFSLKRPWIERLLTLSAGEGPEPLAVCLDNAGGERFSILAADGRAGRIMRISIPRPDGGGVEQPKAFEARSDEELSRWTLRDGAHWLRRIEAMPEGPEAAGVVKWYEDASMEAMTYSASRLNELEGEYGGIVPELFQAYMVVTSPADEAVKEQARKALGLARLKSTQIGRRQVFYRKALAAAMARAIAALTAWPSDFAEKNFGKTAARLSETLKSEYALRKRDLESVLSMIRERVGKPEGMDMAWASAAVAAYLFLYEHLSLLGKALVKLGEDPEELGLEGLFLPAALVTVRKDVTWLPSRVVGALGELLFHWEDYEKAKIFFSAGLRRNDSAKKYYLDNLCRVYEKLGQAREGAALLDEELAREANPETAYYLARLYQMAGEVEKSRAIIEKYGEKAKEEPGLAPLWRSVKTGQKILEEPPVTVSLAAGQSVAESLGGKTPPAGGALRYVRTIKPIHPVTGRPVKPFMALPVSPGKLVINDIWRRELLIYDTDEESIALLKSGVTITGTDVYKPGRLIVARRKDPSRGDRDIAVEILDIDSGEARPIPEGAALPPTPHRIASAGERGFVVTDFFNKQAWLVPRDLRGGERLDIPEIGFNMAMVNDGEFVAAAVAENIVYRRSLRESRGWFFESGYISTPLGCAVDISGVLYVASPEGLWAFGGGGELLWRLVSVSQGEDEYPLAQVSTRLLSISARPDSSGGGIVMCDPENSLAHVFSSQGP
ncbi:MAG: hypothetical protein ACNS63_10225 [Candidatus Nitrospinota bacterium M3_3B_026]